jgi:hypothetical protein
MKLPNVSWPIESENDRGGSEFGGISAVMGSGRAPVGGNIRCILGHGEHAGPPAEQAKSAARTGWKALRTPPAGR